MPAQPEQHVEEASAAIECAQILSMLAKSPPSVLPKARAVRGPGKGKQNQAAPEPPPSVDELQMSFVGVPAPPPIVKSWTPSFPTVDVKPEDGPPQAPPVRRRPTSRAPARPAAMVAPLPPEQVTLTDHQRYGRQTTSSTNGLPKLQLHGPGSRPAGNLSMIQTCHFFHGK